MKLLFGEEVIRNFVLKSANMIDDAEEDHIALIGIKTGGFFLAKRIYSVLKESKRKQLFLGALDITFWRDDISRNPYPIVRGTEIDFPLDDVGIFLIDDVVFTGRTIRAALCEIFEFGRPAYVRLFTVVNRVGREVPIHPDFFSFHIKLSEDESLEVLLREKGFSYEGGVTVKKGEKIRDEDIATFIHSTR